jgi:aminomethyltransferase
MVPADVLALPAGRQRYALFTRDDGGVADDLMIANLGDLFHVVVNAACKEADLTLMTAGLAGAARAVMESDRALLALQGPASAGVLASLGFESGDMRFMDVRRAALAGVEVIVARSGYTGEDGFEISLPAAAADQMARRLLAHDDVLPAGLGARDSLRLEAGLCLYGHDLTEETSPVGAGLEWSIQKSRRSGGARAGGFPGAERILRELEHGTDIRRVGLLPEGRAPMREGTAIFAFADAREPVGEVTSGGFGPSLNAPLAMAYLPAALAEEGALVYGEVRGARLPARVAPMPFVTQRYKRS